MLGLAIRYGHHGDLDAIADLLASDNRDRRASRSAVEELFGRGNFLVLDRDAGALAGSVFLEISEGRGAVTLLTVASDLNAEDLSERLLGVAEMICVAEGCEALELHVQDPEGLPALARELGLEQRGFEQGDGEPWGGRGALLEKRLP